MSFELPVDLIEWLQKMWPLVADRTINKAEASLSNCDATLYWAGTIIRLDLKPLRING